jgi:NAD(P)-dependent dehydrogenase (short-subunit alcohol dehydrogenase family)
MIGAAPVNDMLPTQDGGYELYKAAGKLVGKKALISAGDSGTGRAIAILYAMEGAESSIIYLPGEEEEVLETKRLVQGKGSQVHLIPADLLDPDICSVVVNKAIEYMGCINILVLNHGTHVMKETIEEVTEYAPSTPRTYT